MRPQLTHIRNVVIDWMWELATELKLYSRVIHLAVILFDADLHDGKITSKNAQKNACACILIANNFIDDCNNLTLQSLCDMADNSFTRSSLCVSETDIFTRRINIISNITLYDLTDQSNPFEKTLSELALLTTFYLTHGPIATADALRNKNKELIKQIYQLPGTNKYLSALTHRAKRFGMVMETLFVQLKQ